MKIEIEPIDPAYAKQLLGNMVMNRRVSESRVSQYARDMREGKWNESNAETIKVTADGKLLDGQHRLQAIVLSQKTLCFAVARGVPVDAFVTIDSGKSRTFADVLSIEGHKHIHTTAGITRAVYGYISNVSYSYTPTRPTLEDFITKHPYISEVAAKVGSIGAKVSLPKVGMGTVLYLGTHTGKYITEAEKFLEGVAHGEGLFHGDARYTLRQWLLIQRSQQKAKIHTEHTLVACARAWNAYVEGRSFERVQGKDWSFTRALHVIGFDQSCYAEYPDLKEEAKKVFTSNLPKSIATPPLKLEKK